MRFLVALIFASLACNVAQAGVVVWLNDELPDDKIQKRVDVRTGGGTRHLAAWDLMFPPMPPSRDDKDDIDGLKDVVSDGKKRWNDFEVEYELAGNVEIALDRIDVIRDERDLRDVVEAMLFQGAAVEVAFEPDEFRDGKRAKPYRIERTGGASNRPWSDAYGLQPAREPMASDVADGATFPRLREEMTTFAAVPKGTLLFPPHDEVDKFVVDGVVVEGAQLSVEPGRHFVHLLRQGTVAGRRVVRVESARETQVLPYVTAEELSGARDRVLADTTTGFPESVRESLEVLAGTSDGAVFVAAYQDGDLVVLPYAHGAELAKQRPVTLLGFGEIGGMVMTSKLFDDANGATALAPGVQGALGFELGIYNAVLLAGADLGITPGKTLTYASKAGENVTTSTFLHPFAGAGVYLVRPTGRRATILLAGHYQWLYPAHHGVGGRLAVGIPFEKAGGTWIRLSAGATYAGASAWEANDDIRPDLEAGMLAAFLRAGLAARF